MTLQQWALSFKGSIGRKPFWIGIVIWFLLIVMLFSLQTIFLFSHYTLLLSVILLLYPLAAILTKRLADRGKSGGWFLLLLFAFVLFSVDVSLFTPFLAVGLDDFCLYLLSPYCCWIVLVLKDLITQTVMAKRLSKLIISAD